MLLSDLPITWSWLYLVVVVVWIYASIIIIITALDVVLAPGPPAAAQVATARHLLTGFAALAILGSICS
jgi:hypothetical protein